MKGAGGSDPSTTPAADFQTVSAYVHATWERLKQERVELLQVCGLL